MALGGLHDVHASLTRRMLAVVRECDRREVWRHDGAFSMAAWLVRAMGMSWSSAHTWVKIARRLEELPEIAKTYMAGELSFDQVRVLCRFATADDDADLADYARGASVDDLHHLARRARPVTALEARDTHRQRGLHMYNDHEALGLRVGGFFPADMGPGLRSQIEHRAATYGPNPETGRYDPWPARCADALHELLCGDAPDTDSSDDTGDRGATAQNPTESCSRGRPTVVAHIRAEDLQAQVAAGTGGHLEAGPAISAETARRLCCDGFLQVAAHPDDGTTVAISDTHKAIPERIRRIVRNRDRGCRFPGCGRSGFAELHHLTHRADGGPTVESNLIWTCSFHHRLPHEAGWTICGDPNHEVTWRRPDGKTIRAGPPPHPT
ncbi:MAG: DUF222 domain-containing protein [Acidimicrobiia bacterium]|nr:DUF222 domain-containing protein [Acidimicrobiia bacterium]